MVFLMRVEAANNKQAFRACLHFYRIEDLLSEIKWSKIKLQHYHNFMIHISV